MECSCLFPPQNSQIYNLGGSNDSEIWIYMPSFALHLKTKPNFYFHHHHHHHSGKIGNLVAGF